jgi:hypothetical protein
VDSSSALARPAGLVNRSPEGYNLQMPNGVYSSIISSTYTLLVGGRGFLEKFYCSNFPPRRRRYYAKCPFFQSNQEETPHDPTGRKSSAELAVVPGVPRIDSIQKPDPPAELTPDQAETWKIRSRRCGVIGLGPKTGRFWCSIAGT